MISAINALLIVFFFIADSISDEICPFETRQLTCMVGNMIQVINAEYGRMSMGHCIAADFGFIGCKSTVTHIIESRCGGRESCEIALPDEELGDLRPCPVGFSSYLTVQYSCLPSKHRYIHILPPIPVNCFYDWTCLFSHSSIFVKFILINYIIKLIE